MRNFSASDLLRGNISEIIALGFGEVGAGQDLQAIVLGQTERRIDLRVDLAGKRAVVSFFSAKGGASNPQAAREIALLGKLNGSSLTPRARGFSNDHGFVVREWIDGHSLSSALNDETVVDLARRLGTWAKNFCDLSAASEEAGDWHSYLSELETFARGEQLTQQESLLKANKFTEKRIAANISKLDRLIVTPEGKFCAIELSSASLKPPQWDLLILARGLARRCPGKSNDIAEALSVGWHGETSTAAVSSTISLIKIFLMGTAFKPLGENRSKLARTLDKFNKLHGENIKQAFLTPYLDRPDVDPTEPERAAFVAHLEAECARAEAGETKTANEQAPFDATPQQSSLLQAMCAQCRGHCCMPGKEKHAFLTAAELAKKAGSTAHDALKNAADFYVQALPKRHIEGSCLYHTDAGCALPRDVRAPICHTYYCKPAKEVFRGIAGIKSPKSTAFFDRDFESDFVSVYRDSEENSDPEIIRTAVRPNE